ncbi:MAG: ATP-binding protein, partial [Lachnospiraceae bacterium]|nr:ATP-binding protein [Lachnospiraceae bacterium]
MTQHVLRGKNKDDVLLEKLLSLSPVESQMVEFKIGISYFTSGKVNTKVIEKIGKTLVAMANTKCSFMEEGYVILGGADRPSSCHQWKAASGETQFVYGAHQ